MGVCLLHATSVLHDIDSKNRATLENLQKCLFIMCLDDSLGNLQDSTGQTPHPALERSPINRAIATNNLHGNGHNAGNRWFDKTLQFIVTRDGGVGLNFEHTPFDGHVAVAAMESALRGTVKWEKEVVIWESEGVDAHHIAAGEPVRLEWVVSAPLKEYLKEAENALKE